MTTSDEQWFFLKCLARLILHAELTGQKLTGGTLYRDAAYNAYIGGSATSMHQRRMAIDLNLFHGQNYIRSSQAFMPLARYWESLDPRCSSGIRFNDGNHFSFHERKHDTRSLDDIDADPAIVV